MESVTQNAEKSKRYLPHKISTKVHSVETYRKTGDIGYICRKYHISKASLMRWNRLYDGTRESLMPKSHRPHKAHPKAHTEQEIKWIKDYHRRNPNISICELYGKLQEEKAYSRHPGKYDTPTKIGEKWQLDVKYVPIACYSGKDGEKFFQYTGIEEASRKRFIYPYKEQSGYSTVDFIKRAVTFFGYAPKVIQTDNGGEFTNFKKTDRVHIFERFCHQYGIEHKPIRPRTPWHNGKVERSPRNDQERFYNHMSFYSYNDLLVQMKRYLNRSNNIPMQILGWKSPLEKRHELET